jgi:hypothetical protein
VFPDVAKCRLGENEVRKEVVVSQVPHAPPRDAHPSGAGRAQFRIAIVVAACLIVEAIVAKNVLDVTIDIVAFLAPLWVFAISQAWPTATDKAYEIATMMLAVAATAGVLIFYSL